MESTSMDLSALSEADAHLIYGLLLKKRRSRAQDRKVLSIVRSTLELKEKIQAILNVTRVQVRELAVATDGAARPSPEAPEGRKRKPALIIDDKPEITRLLKKCALKRELAFSKANERFDALHLVLQLRPRLVVVNESFERDEEYPRYYEICRAIEPGIRIVFLGAPSGPVKATASFHAFTRFLPKPLNMEKLEETVRTLLAAGAGQGAPVVARVAAPAAAPRK
jgi:ActR/RegA family two-component response regulator